MKKKTPKENQYKKPHIGEIIKGLCVEFKLEEAPVLDFLKKQYPELLQKEKCANCGASMAMYEHQLDHVDALLLLAMGKIVGKRAKTFMFTEANQVHIRELTTSYSVKLRMSWCSKLGLIAKIRHKDGSHNRRAGWCITKRGFEFLAGKPVPKKVQTFRNQITERFEEMITMAEIMKKKMDRSHLDELKTHGNYAFDKLEAWAVAGFAQGVLLR